MSKEKIKYNSFYDWSVGEPEAYRAAKSKGLLEKIEKDFNWTLQNNSDINNIFDMLQKNRDNVDKNNIDGFYENFKTNISFLNEEMSKFLGPTKNDTAALRARKIIKNIEEDSIILRKLIQIKRNNK